MTTWILAFPDDTKVLQKFDYNLMEDEECEEILFCPKDHSKWLYKNSSKFFEKNIASSASVFRDSDSSMERSRTGVKRGCKNVENVGQTQLVGRDRIYS